jgi:hypothetical protein
MNNKNNKIQMMIMKDLNIKYPDKVFYAIEKECPYTMQIINNCNKKFNYNMDIISQCGGGKIRKIEYMFDNKQFIFYEEKISNRYELSIHQNDNIDNANICVYLIIDKDEHIANIQWIYYDKKCVRTGLTYPGGCSIILKLCIDFLKKNKKYYDINRIQLTDKSYFVCKKNNKHIDLPIFHTLMFGQTWYGKYGFRPFDSYNNIRDELKYKRYKENYKIVTTKKLKDTTIHKYMKSEFLTKYENMTIIEFFYKHFFEDFQGTCEKLHKFYLDFATENGIYNFIGHPFYLDI